MVYQFVPISRTECGHTFCSACLRTWFETGLSARIRAYGTLDHGNYSHHEGECSTVPKTDLQLKVLVKAMREHGRYIPWLFRYSCPHCRARVVRKPILDYAFSQMLDSLWDSFKDRVHVELTMNSIPSPFSGLFYDSVHL